jgi:hypothetical protein
VTELRLIGVSIEVGRLKLLVAEPSKPSVYLRAVVDAIVATRFTLFVPVTAWACVESTTKVQLRVVPALICWPAVVAPRAHVTEQVFVPVQAADVVPTVRALLFSSSNLTPARKVVEDGAVPEKVTVTVFTASAPALFAEKAKVASWSLEILPRPVVAPSGVAAKLSLVRKTVWGLPDAAETVTVDEALDVCPSATTARAVVLFVASVVVAMLKLCAELSEEPEDE